MNVLVVGGGVMGNGIAQVVATAGLDVTVVDVERGRRWTARARGSSAAWAASCESGRLTEDDADGVRSRIATRRDWSPRARPPTT